VQVDRAKGLSAATAEATALEAANQKLATVGEVQALRVGSAVLSSQVAVAEVAAEEACEARWRERLDSAERARAAAEADAEQLQAALAAHAGRQSAATAAAQAELRAARQRLQQVQLERDTVDQRATEELAAIHHDAVRDAEHRDAAHAAALAATHAELAALRTQVQALSAAAAAVEVEAEPAEPSLRLPMAEVEALCGVLGSVGGGGAAPTAAAVLRCRDAEVDRLASMLEREAAARTAEHQDHCRHLYTLLSARLNASRTNSPAPASAPAGVKALPTTPVVRRGAYEQPLNSTPVQRSSSSSSHAALPCTPQGISFAAAVRRGSASPATSDVSTPSPPAAAASTRLLRATPRMRARAEQRHGLGKENDVAGTGKPARGLRLAQDSKARSSSTLTLSTRGSSLRK